MSIGFEMPADVLDDYDDEKPFGSGGGRPSKGFHHAQLERVEEIAEVTYSADGNTEIGPHTDLHWRIVGPGDDYEKTVRDTIWHEGSDAEKTVKLQLRAFGIARKIGLVTGSMIEQWKASKTNPTWNFQDGVNLQAIIEVRDAKRKSPTTGLPYAEIPWSGYYSLTDKEAEKTRINHELAAMAGFTMENQRQMQPAQTAAATVGGDADPMGFGDL
jgi:hypothetical protein